MLSINTKLTPHFTLSEFWYTSHEEYQELNRSNLLADPILVTRAAQIAIFLEKLRTSSGGPIRITSGYRNSSLNRAVGGVNNSDHCKMLAVDIYCETEEDANNHLFTINHVFKKFIRYVEYNTKKKYMHISFCNFQIDESMYVNLSYYNPDLKLKIKDA